MLDLMDSSRLVNSGKEPTSQIPMTVYKVIVTRVMSIPGNLEEGVETCMMDRFG